MREERTKKIIRAALVALLPVAVACSHAPPASVPPSASVPTPLPRPHSQVIHVMFPAGSTLQPSDIPSLPGVPPDAETWVVPLAVVDEIADLRVQLPIGVPFDDGRPSCGEHSFPARPGSIQWSWGTPQAEPLCGDFLAVSVMAGGLKTSEVGIMLHLINPEPGCP
jgi:hypothetical protein